MIRGTIKIKRSNGVIEDDWYINNPIKSKNLKKLQ